MKLSRAVRMVVIGAPGVGKGTQAERLLERFPQLSTISSGDLLRENVKNRTALGIKAEQSMKAGGLVPDAMILRLIFNELKIRGWLKPSPSNTYTLAASSSTFEASDLDTDTFVNSPSLAESQPPPTLSDTPSASFILDGFPRTTIQATQLDALIPINLAVLIRTPTSVLLDRIAGRWVHPPSGRVYNTTWPGSTPKVPFKDDITGEPLVKRSDDCPEVWRERLKKFDETSQPLLEHYNQRGVLWEVEGNASDEITPKLLREFENRFATD